MLDVTFGEDACPTREANAAGNFSSLRKLALFFLKSSPPKIPIKPKISKSLFRQPLLAFMPPRTSYAQALGSRRKRSRRIPQSGGLAIGRGRDRLRRLLWRPGAAFQRWRKGIGGGVRLEADRLGREVGVLAQPVAGALIPDDDGLLERNRLAGARGDAINAILVGAGHNFRLLLAWVRLLLRLLPAVLSAAIEADAAPKSTPPALI